MFSIFGIFVFLCVTPLRIDYSDAQALCSALIKLGYIYFDLWYTKAYTIPIDSQKIKVSELISYMQIGKEVTKLGSQELKNVFFNFLFFFFFFFFFRFLM